MMGKKSVFLDRDGVINRTNVVDGKPYAPRDIADFDILPEVAAAARLLRESGFVIVIVTNQPDIGNGLVDQGVVQQMNEIAVEATGADAIYMCPHRQDEGCACRKPRPGMLEAASKALNLELSGSYMVGDRGSDIAAGKAAGCRTLFLDRGYAEKLDTRPEYIVQDLGEAVDLILQLERD